MLSLETQQTQSGSFKTKVAVAVAATAAIGIVAAVTLSSSDSAVRQTTGLFNIPEDIKGHFSGGQTTGEWTVQGKFHKFETASGDWQINSKLVVEGPTMGGSETYTLVDNVLVMVPAYGDMESKMQCGDRDNLPAYAKWAEHLDKASALSKDRMGDNLQQAITDNCPVGSEAVVVVVEEREYIICADSTANTRAMYAFNQDFSFSAVSREGMTVTIEHPAGWEELNCTTFDASLTREQAAQFAGKLADDADRDLISMSMFEQGYYGGGGGGYGSNGGGGSSSGTPQKKCAFYHGVGGNGDRVGLQTRFDDYWGENKVGKYCSNSLKYLDTDSQTRGYDSSSYHQEICTTLNHADFSSESTSVIFTHSMGGLTTRRAFANGACSWTGAYHQSQAPMSGSKAANFASAACLTLSQWILGWIVKWTLLANYCNPFGLLAWAGYQTIYNNNPWYGSGGKKANGRLCGSKPLGLGGGIAIGLAAIQLFSGLQRRNDWCIIPSISCGWRGCRTSGCILWWRCPYNDGMVDWDACAQRHKSAATSVKRMGINHADGTGRQGDRSGGSSIDQWYQQRSMLAFSEASHTCTSCLTQYGAFG